MRKRSTYLISVSRSRSAASKSAWRGFIPPLPHTYRFHPFSVAMMPTSLLCASALSRVQPDTAYLSLCGALSPLAVPDHAREADAILHAVAAPGRADARFHGAHGFAVRMARFEPGVDQLFPYERQLVHLRAEEIDALTARDLRVKTVLLRDRADRDQLVRGDLAARD